MDGVLSIERACFTQPWSLHMFEALYQINPDGFYVAVIDESIVGYAIVLMQGSRRYFLRHTNAHLMNLAVYPSLRNQGIGRNLIAVVISYVKKVGAEELSLEVRTSNTNAIAFYKQLGFKRTGVVKRFYGNEDAQVMVKRI